MPLKSGRFLILPLHTSLLVLVLLITRMALLMSFPPPLVNLVLNCNYIYESMLGWGLISLVADFLIRLYCLYQLSV